MKIKEFNVSELSLTDLKNTNGGEIITFWLVAGIMWGLTLGAIALREALR